MGPNNFPAALAAVMLIIATLATGTLAEWSLEWTGEPGFEEEGVEPNEGHNGTRFEFRVRFDGGENNATPSWVKLFIDLDGNGRFQEGETFPMTRSKEDPSIWYIEKTIRVNGDNRPSMAYYFEAMADNKIRSSQLAFGPTITGYNNSFVIKGTGWFLKEAMLPMEVRTMEKTDRITFINTSGSPQRLLLSIPEDAPGPFEPGEDVNAEQINTYVLSALITDIDADYVSPDNFNEEGSEDVVTFQAKRAKGPVFNSHEGNWDGVVRPGESVSIWLQLQAPKLAIGPDAADPQWVYIKVEVESSDY